MSTSQEKLSKPLTLARLQAKLISHGLLSLGNEERADYVEMAFACVGSDWVLLTDLTLEEKVKFQRLEDADNMRIQRMGEICRKLRISTPTRSRLNPPDAPMKIHATRSRTSKRSNTGIQKIRRESHDYISQDSPYKPRKKVLSK